MDLDNIRDIRALDPEGMADRISELPDQLRQSWQLVSQLTLPEGYADVDNVVICGMGGSAIGSDLVRTLVAGEARVPIQVNRDYSLPAYIGRRSLVIVSSYSGNTEESLAGFALARVAGAKVAALTTGGELLKQCREHGIPVAEFGYKSQPRAALGHSLAPVLAFLQKAGIVGDQTAAVEEAARVLDSQRAHLGIDSTTERNAAKQLARALSGRIPVIYGAELTAEVARRWKGQMNENAKTTAVYDVLPELNHNTVVGYDFPHNLAELAHVVFLLPKTLHSRVAVRVGATQALLKQRGIEWHTVESEGDSPLAQMMSVVNVGDWTSYYLALLNGVDPTPVKAIDFLKEQVSKA